MLKVWPGQDRTQRRRTVKVPTRIQYQPNDPDWRHAAWGYRAASADALGWFKLFLEEDFSGVGEHYADEINKLKETYFLPKADPLGKTAVDVTADFLSCLWEYAKRPDQLGEMFSNTDEHHVVLTIPAVWTPNAVDKMAEAARIAELPNVQFVTEPEAAILAYINDMEGPGHRLEVHDSSGPTEYLMLIYSKARSKGYRMRRRRGHGCM